MAENNYQNYIYKRPDTGKYYSLVSGVARELTDSPAEIEKQFGTNIQSLNWGVNTTGYTQQYGGGTTGGAWNLANMRNTIDTLYNTQVPKAQQVAVSPYVSPQQITQPQPQAQQPVQQLAQQPIQQPVQSTQQPQQPVQQPQAPTSTYTVKAGDTLSNIAGSMGVNINAISGYKSGNPNLIYPGEVLTINKPTQMAMAGTPDVPVSYADSRSQFVQPEYQQNPLWLRPGETIDAYNTRVAQLRGETYTPGLAGYPTKEQVDIAKTGLAQGKTMEEVKSDVMTQLSNVGVNTSKISESASPVTNIKTILEDVMKSMNLPDIKTRMEEYAKEVTNLKDKQAKEISEINENPWLSEGLRTKKIAAVSDKYSGMISNKTNEFDLLQGMYDDARQQAQYAATLATNIYQKDRDYLLDQMELLTKQAETRSSAILKAGPLTTETIGGFTVLRDAEGNIVSTVKPEISRGEPEPIPVSPYQKERAVRTTQSVDELKIKARKSPGIFGRTAALPIPEFARSASFRNFKAELDTLKATIAFGELTAMREASKTGGALGQVSNIELGLLESALGALNMTQSPKNFQAQLQKVKDSINRWQNEVTKTPLKTGISGTTSGGLRYTIE